MKSLSVCLLFSALACSAAAQNNTTQNLKNTIYYLASDKLEGRNTGSPGEKLASDYIILQYRQIGILPKGDSGKYIQTFHFPFGKSLHEDILQNRLYLGKADSILVPDSAGHLLKTARYQYAVKPGSGYFPLSYSGNGHVVGSAPVNVGYGIVAKDKNRDDYSGKEVSGKIVLIQVSTPDGDNPHSDLYPYSDLQTKIKTAEDQGAAAVIFYNENEKAEDPKYDLTKNTPAEKIPVVFLEDSLYKKIFVPGFAGPIRLDVNLNKVERVGHNVVGYIDNGAATTVVIGAHYDHLGWGHDGNSLYTGPEAIHHGADDNASGTAAVIELARLLKNSKDKNNNYLFLNFSGEELGLIGSNYFVNHATIDTAKINYMINMDMVGRYRPDKGMDVEGLGTSPSFAFIKTFAYDTLKLKYSDKGTGPTDHTSFYYANIPVLNFFTGTHEDYHKPSDLPEKINYTGETTIVNYIHALIDSLNGRGRMHFTRTSDQKSGDLPKFTVRLGIIPDYLYDGSGLRVDGVSVGLPAEKAGIQKGDIIIKMGDLSIADINTYMKGLSMFMKGDKTIIRVKRGDKEIDLPVQF